MTWLKNCVLGEDIVASPSSSPPSKHANHRRPGVMQRAVPTSPAPVTLARSGRRSRFRTIRALSLSLSRGHLIRLTTHRPAVSGTSSW